MSKARNPRTPSPRSIASLSTALLIVTSVGITFYFGELRGPGLQSFLAGNLVEVGILCGILVALVVTGHAAVVNAVRQSRASSPYRAIVRRAAKSDVSDPAVVNEFEAAPELADLVRRLVAEHARVKELTESFESLRRDIRGVASGMRRSRDDLRPVRQDISSPSVAELAHFWNELLEMALENGAPSAASGSLGAGNDDLVVESQGASHNVETMASSRDLATRLQRLEETLRRLVDRLTPAAVAAPFVEEAAPAFDRGPSTRPSFETPSSPAFTGAHADSTHWSVEPDTSGDDNEIVEIEPHQRKPAVPWNVKQAPKPEVWGEEESSAVDPSEPDPTSFRMPPFKVPQVGTQGTARNAPAPGVPDAPKQPAGRSFGEAELQAPETANEPRFEDLDFPHFVGRPVRKPTSHVEVTYGRKSATGPNTHSFIEEDEVAAGDEVVDLRSLGAVEFKE